jgi:hypothetical protein
LLLQFGHNLQSKLKQDETRVRFILLVTAKPNAQGLSEEHQQALAKMLTTHKTVLCKTLPQAKEFLASLHAELAS